MGLDFSHCNASWGYIGFMRFREKLYHGAGYSGELRSAYDSGAVEKMKNDPLYPFIIHSDCEGKLTVKELKAILPRIEAIVKNWPDTDYDKAQANELIKGMQTAIKKKQPLKFL